MIFTNEIFRICFFIITIILLAVVLIIRIRNEQKVDKISVNIAKLRELNSKCNFKIYFKRKYNISFPTKTVVSFKNSIFDNVVLYNIENNLDDLRNTIEDMRYNKDLYIDYITFYNNLNYETDIITILESHLKEKQFKEIEKRLMKRYKIKDKLNIKAHVSISYTSPKGRNSYYKDCYFNSEELSHFYDVWKEQCAYKISAQYERLQMSDSLRYDVLKRDNFTCQICGATAKDGAKLHVDHIKPVAKGGKTELSNLQTLCERCNIGKSDKI